MSSCKFADRVAALSIATYRSLCPPELLFQQTVLATIVLQMGTGRHTELRLAALGVGTKVLSQEQIEEAGRHPSGSEALRDMHAEVLARRAFLRFLVDQVSLCASHSADGGVLELANGMYRIRDGVSVHMYSSSQPCGNACIKRWAKARKAVEHAELDADSLPDLPHPAFAPTAVGDGEVAALVKTNRCRLPADPDPYLLPAADGRGHAPPGTAPATSGLGNVMTCSDKLALWNALGLQGALLSLLLPQPVYLRSITIGRKYSEAHCRRALCCRIARFRCANGYSTHHPALLTSRLKLDEGSLLVEAGAQFTETRCLAAWALPHGYCTEVLDGRTGRTADGAVSLLSSRSQADAIRPLLLLLPTATAAAAASVLEMKAAAADYQQAKARLRAAPFCFADWIRKPAG